MSNEDEQIVKDATKAISALTHELRAFIPALSAALSVGMVTRCDLNAAEARIVKAIGERIDPQKLEKLSTKLEAATAPLEKAVAENQPG